MPKNIVTEYIPIEQLNKLIEVMRESRGVLDAKREVSLVITKLEEAKMWYLKALDIQEGK